MIILYSLLALAIVAVVSSGVAAYRADKQTPQLIAEIQEGKCRSLKELDEALADWLEMLELPQFAEETKRLEAARRLRTVLIAKLLRSPVPHCNPNK